MLPISNQLKNQDPNSGILLVNSQRQISGLTPSLLKIWNVPELILRSLSDRLALQFVAEQFDNPQVFLKNMTEIYKQTHLEIHEKSILRDGRTIERYSKPLWTDGAYAGRLWIFKLNQ